MQDAQVGSDGAISRHLCTTYVEFDWSAHGMQCDAVGSDGSISRLDCTPFLEFERLVHGTPRVPNCGDKGHALHAIRRLSSGSVSLRRRLPCTTYTTVQQVALVPVDNAYLEALGGGAAGVLQNFGTKPGSQDRALSRSCFGSRKKKTVKQGCDNSRNCIDGVRPLSFVPFFFEMCGLDMTLHVFWRVLRTGEAASNQTPSRQHVLQDAQVGSDGAISRHLFTTALEIDWNAHGTRRLPIGSDGGSAGHAKACRREVGSFPHRGAQGSVLVEISDSASMEGSGPFTAFVCTAGSPRTCRRTCR